MRRKVYQKLLDWKQNRKGDVALDFLIQKPTITSRHNISPIEVKSGKKYTLTSLNSTPVTGYGLRLWPEIRKNVPFHRDFSD